jgi:peptide/nickel transport system ATP-binding protein
LRESVLEIDNLTFGYSKERLLYKNFSLTVKRGEVVTIVGESGSGKSTLFELITREQKPISGEIKVKRCAQIFQDPYSSFHPTYNIIEQIGDVVSTKDIDRHLNDLNLEKELLYKKPHTLSGGQLQRCSILRAILQKPDIILADEPTSALDNVVALEVMRLLIGFLDKSAILLITHDEYLAKWISDKIIYLSDEAVVS